MRDKEHHNIKMTSNAWSLFVKQTSELALSGFADSSAPPCCSVGVDVLEEGQHYLGISMLVYAYSELREMCRMGHTRLTFEEIDVKNASTEITTLIKNHKNMKTLPLRQQRRTNITGSLVASVTSQLLEEQRQQQSHYYLHNNTKTSFDIIHMLMNEIGEELDNNPATTMRQSFERQSSFLEMNENGKLIDGENDVYEERYDMMVSHPPILLRQTSYSQ